MPTTKKNKIIIWLCVIIGFGALVFISIPDDPKWMRRKDDPVKIAQKYITDSTSKAKSDSTKKYNAEYKKLKLVEIPAKLKKLRKEKDDFKGTTFYHHKGEPKGYSSNIHIYLGENSGTYYERVVLSYTGSDWLFVNRLEFLCDGNTYTLIPDEVKRDNSGGDVYEWIDASIDYPELRRIIFAIAYSKDAKVRYIGDQYRHDRKIRANEKSMLREMYEILN